MWRRNLVGGGIDGPSAAVPRGRECGILRCRGIKQGLRVGDVATVLRRTEDAKVDGQVIVESHLSEVEFGHEVVVADVADDGFTSGVGHRCAVVGFGRAAGEGHVMVLHAACPCGQGSIVHVVPPIDVGAAELLRSLHILMCRKHLQVAIDALPSPVAIVGNLEFAIAPFFRGHEDDTGSTARTILCGFRSVFQYFKLLNVGGVNRTECGEVGGNTVDDDQGIVAAHNRTIAAHADACEHRQTLCCATTHIHTGNLPRNGADGTVHHSTVEVFVGNTLQQLFAPRE